LRLKIEKMNVLEKNQIQTCPIGKNPIEKYEDILEID